MNQILLKGQIQTCDQHLLIPHEKNNNLSLQLPKVNPNYSVQSIRPKIPLPRSKASLHVLCSINDGHTPEKWKQTQDYEKLNFKMKR